MRIVWQAARPLQVRQVHALIAAQRGVAYTTTMTTMVHLAEKGLLNRGKVQGLGGAYLFTPARSEQAFVAERLADSLGAVERDYPAAIARYLDTRRGVAVN